MKLNKQTIGKPFNARAKLNAVISALVFTVFTLAAINVNAGERINNKESLRICKSAAQEELGGEGELKFQRKTATSVESDRFRHWINVVELASDAKTSKKLLCETTRTGELLSMHVEPGRWGF